MTEQLEPIAEIVASRGADNPLVCEGCGRVIDRVAGVEIPSWSCNTWNTGACAVCGALAIGVLPARDWLGAGR